MAYNQILFDVCSALTCCTAGEIGGFDVEECYWQKSVTYPTRKEQLAAFKAELKKQMVDNGYEMYSAYVMTKKNESSHHEYIPGMKKVFQELGFKAVSSYKSESSGSSICFLVKGAK